MGNINKTISIDIEVINNNINKLNSIASTIEKQIKLNEELSKANLGVKVSDEGVLRTLNGKYTSMDKIGRQLANYRINLQKESLQNKLKIRQEKDLNGLEKIKIKNQKDQEALGFKNMRTARMMAISLMVLGYATQRAIKTIATTTISSFQEIIATNGFMNTNLNVLAATWQYLKFTIGSALNSALGPFIPMIINIVNKVADWIQTNSGLVAGIVAVVGVLTTFAVARGFLEYTGVFPWITSLIKQMGLLGGAVTPIGGLLNGLLRTAAVVVGLKLAFEAIMDPNLSINDIISPALLSYGLKLGVRGFWILLGIELLLKFLFNGTETVKSLGEWIGKLYGVILNAFTWVVTSIQNLWDAVWGKISFKEASEKSFSGIGEAIKTGFFKGLSETANEATVEIYDLSSFEGKWAGVTDKVNTYGQTVQFVKDNTGANIFNMGNSVDSLGQSINVAGKTWENQFVESCTNGVNASIKEINKIPTDITTTWHINQVYSGGGGGGSSNLGGNTFKQGGQTFSGTPNKKVKDAIISPNGRIISTSPQDYLIATKNPTSLMNKTFGGTTDNNQNINITMNNNFSGVGKDTASTIQDAINKSFQQVYQMTKQYQT